MGDTRKCCKCHIEKPLVEFMETKSMYMPGHRSIICYDCLGRMIDFDQLDEVDKLFQWLDKPFIVDQWTRLYKQDPKNTLRLYAKIVDETEQYKNLDWTFTNNLWRDAMQENSMVDHIAGADDAWLIQMARKWPSEIERTAEDYHYLENLYNDILATQNLVTATQRDDAKRLCEVGLLINKKIRGGLDAKKEMDMYHNIIKAEGFEPKNSKNVGDFDSVGELFTWLEKRKWKPNWHTEPQDSVDYTIKQMQTYTRRLIEGEGALGDAVADKRKRLELAEKLEAEGGDIAKVQEEEAMAAIVYEGEEDLMASLEDGDDDALN